MKNKKQILIIALVMTVLLLCLGQAQAVTILPDPTSNFDGIPFAIQYDDFYSYSAKLLDLWGYPGYNFATGTGTLDLIVYTGAGTKNRNIGVGAGGAFNFEDPMSAPTGGPTTSFSGWWGQDDQDNDGTADSVNGPVSVDNMVNYLHTTFGSDVNIPVFYFDMNQTGDVPDLQVLGDVYIWDPSTSTRVKSWAFDSAFQAGDGTFDPGAWVTSPGEISVTGISGTTYTVNNNLGSGKPEFIVYAPTMDLTAYTGKGYEFVGNFRMQGLNDGFEELFLTGRYSPFVIPEPATLFLLGSGLLGLLGLKKRRS